MREFRIGIAGLGTVAQGVLGIIAKNGSEIAHRSGVELVVGRIASRSAKPEVDLLGAEFSTNLDDLLQDESLDVLLELIGGEDVAHDFIRKALDLGRPVVTANKAVVAAHGDQLFGANQPVSLRFEAAVAGAIPVIQAIRESLVANRFEHVVGIINGTCNYILTAMRDEGRSFEDALSTAQELGYAEADPTFDVGGIDAAHKLTILLALAFDASFDFSSVHVEGITGITAEDISYADELGYRIKHVGIARRTDKGLEARAHPALIPEDQLLANVNGVLNAVLVKTDAAGNTLFSGPGAGSWATGSAVLADVVATCQEPDAGVRQNSRSDVQRPAILPVEETTCAHYLRIPTRDEPGVFASVAETLSNHGISIEAAIQKQPATTQDIVSIVIVTQPVLESEAAAAVREVEQLDQVVGQVARIRIETL